MSAIKCRDAGKVFRRFSERNQTLKQVVARRRRAVFTEHWAVRDLTLEIAEGETFGIIGGNGAGKSTTLKLLAGILVPDEGSVQVTGRVSALLELGAGFHPELSGRENVFLNGAILGMSRKTLLTRFDDIVGFAGLEESIDEPVKTYSSGMFARLGFAVAVNVDPDILLLDEVLAVGDEVFQRRCGEKVAELRSSGKTVVIVSHGLQELRKMCRTIAWIDHGTVKAVGPSIDVVNEYLESTRDQQRISSDGLVHTGTGIVTTFVRTHPEVVVQDGSAEFEFTIDCAEAIVEPRLGFTIRSSDGTPVVGHTMPLPTLAVGTHRSTYRMGRIPLTPGHYEIATWFGDRNGVELDSCLTASGFEVKPPSGGSHDFGLLTLGGTWETT